MAAVEVRVGQDGLAGDIVEGDILRRQFGCRGDHDGVADAFRLVMLQRNACMPPRLPPMTAAQAVDAE
jgi:hypothetical protein